MSLPISTIGAIAGAARVATSVAQDIGRSVNETIGFDKVLSGENAKPASEQLGEAIRGRLVQAGIGVNQDLAISVTDSGQLRVEGNRERAAEIESILNSDAQIGELAKQLSAAEKASGLTITGDQETIRNSSGGYPNW